MSCEDGEQVLTRGFHSPVTALPGFHSSACVNMLSLLNICVLSLPPSWCRACVLDHLIFACIV